MVIVFLRVFIMYFFVVMVVRMMGKRQIAQMQPFELVVTILIADLASIPLGNTAIPLVYGLIPVITLLSIQVIVSYLSIKSEGFREIICGKPSVIINKGVIVQSEIKRLRISMNDLLEQFRAKDQLNLSDIEYAILETNGMLSVIPKATKKPATLEDLKIAASSEELPITLVVDGEVIMPNLKKAGYDLPWLDKKLKENSINSLNDVFFAFLSSKQDFYVQRKQKEEGA